ncbi:uncharacterized protein LOC127712618 isoform X2 [Mytilus californianus]|uniref:uncharacterized protein LOC127712618 isoform X2 n=1 Tax=Mytilus californianus TaxID=6549 RepID=UPI0022486F1B|nr:uncharacterized protein LOC127712618 isoform X2 [Mytilus californianus]
MASRISEEESNYLKVVVILLRIATPLVRIQFDKEFHPIQLKKELQKARPKLHRLLSLEQMDLLYPKTGVPESQMFDITLMILLIKNLTKIEISDVLPYQTRNNLGAHLSRIKIYRNMIAHSKHGTISNTDFAECWENITIAVVGLGGHKKECEELETKLFSAYELSLVPDEIRFKMLKNELSEVLDKVIGIVEKVTSNELQDDDDDFGASDDHTRLWTLFTDTGRQVLYHFVELRLPPTQDGTYSLRKFFDKHRNIFHQPCCLCLQQISEDGPSGGTKRTNCFPEYFDKTNVSVEDCPLNDLIGYLMKAGKCNETEKNWFETIMQTIQAQTSWDDLEKIKYLAEPVRYKNIVQLQINTLKMVVDEYKLLYRKKKKGLISHKEGGHEKCAKGQDLSSLENDEYMERFEKRTAKIKISKRKLENTEEWDVTISTEEKRAKMRIDGLAEKEEIKVLDERDLFQCEIGTTSSLKIVNVKKGSIQLYLRAAPNAFKSHKSFRSSIRAVIQRVLEVGQVDTSIEGTFYVQVTFDTGETRDRIGVIQQLIYQNTMDKELDKDTKQNEDIEARNRELVEIVHRLKNENEEIKTRNRELEESVNRLNEENEEIQRRDRELEETVDRLKENEDLHKNRMGELESKMTRLKVANEANKELQTKNRELAEAVNRLKGKNEVLRKNIKEQPVDRFNQLAKISDKEEDTKLEDKKIFLMVISIVPLPKDLKDANKGKVTELSRFLEKNYGSNYTNNFMITVNDKYNRGFFETTFEDQKDSLDKGTVECLNNKVGEPEWKLDLFREINGYEYEEMENSWYFGEEEQNKVLSRKNM